MKIMACRSNVPLAQKIAKALESPLYQPDVRQFADQEISLQIKESVLGDCVFVIQSTSSPANDHLMELLLAIDALKRSIAKRIVVVLPYYGYARQDRKTDFGTPISAKLVGDMIAAAGAHQIICLDWHTEQMQGFFNIPAYDIDMTKIFVPYLQNLENAKNMIIVSPDIGGVRRARKIADGIGVDIAVVDKRRSSTGVPQALSIIGDVKGKNCIIVDDIVDSGKTLCLATNRLYQAGAAHVSACITHGVFSKNAVLNIQQSSLERVTITDSIHHPEGVLDNSKIEVLSVSGLLARAIQSFTGNL